jgi:hypothetical protein
MSMNGMGGPNHEVPIISSMGEVSLSHLCHAVGYDWDLPFTSYSYQIQFIHIKGV